MVEESHYKLLSREVIETELLVYDETNSNYSIDFSGRIYWPTIILSHFEDQCCQKIIITNNIINIIT